MTFPFMRTFICVTLIALFAGSWLIAAPVRPRKLEIPDEERVLAGIESLSLNCEFYSPAIPAAGVEKQTVIKNIGDLLKAAGFEVRDDDLTPRATIQFFTATSDETPGAIAVTTILAVHQSVNIKRLNDDMVLPVSQIVTTAVCKRDNLAVTVERETKKVTQLLVTYVKRASSEQKVQ